MWSEYASFLISKYNEDNNSSNYSRDKISRVLEKGYNVVKYDIPESNIVWDQYRDFIATDLEIPQKRDATISKIKEMYLQRLAIPHKCLSDTFSDFSSFITTYDNNNYEKELVSANKIYQNTLKALELRTRWEQSLYEARSLDNYASYIYWEITLPKKHQEPHLVGALYERTILDYPYVPEVWDDYLFYTTEKLYTDNLLSNIIDRSLLANPFSGVLWAHKLRYLTGKIVNEEICDLKQTFDNISVFKEPEKYNDWKSFMTEWVTHFTKKFGPVLNDPNDSSLFEKVLEGCEDAIERIMRDGKDDANFDLEVMISNFFTKIQYDNFVWEKLKKTRGNYSEYWIQWASCVNKSEGYEKSKVRLIFEEAINRKNLDWPEKVFEEYVLFERNYGTCHSVQKALAKTRILSKLLQHRRQQTQASKEGYIQSEKVDSVEIISHKRAHEDIDDVVLDQSNYKSEDSETKSKKSSHQNTRDRENNTIVVSGFSKATTEKDLQKFFNECGEIISINIGENNVGILEFADHISALSALTKDMKKIKGHEISVRSGEATTLYVTNFPPEFNESDIQQLFEQYGQILSIRFPSLKFNTHRRFCYVQFSSGENARKASETLNGEQIGELTMQVLISDPSKKTSRKGALYEDREVFIKGLDFNSVDEKELRSILRKYGTIDRIRLPLNRTNEKQGRLHDGYGFVVFGSSLEAEAVIKSLNGTKLGSRTIYVSLASDKNTGPKKLSKVVFDNGFEKEDNNYDRNDILARTLSISNLSDTVNDSQLRVIFEKYGPLKQILLRPDLNSAKVEYVNVADAGKAELALQGHLISGQPITINAPNVQNAKSAVSGLGHLSFIPRAAMRNKRL